jgi:hypothetical protein
MHSLIHIPLLLDSVPDAFLTQYTIIIHNAFMDLREVWDRDQHPEIYSRFFHGGAWVGDSKNIEAVAHAIVHAAFSLHITGAKGLHFKCLPDQKPPPGCADATLTFKQRIWVLEAAETLQEACGLSDATSGCRRLSCVALVEANGRNQLSRPLEREIGGREAEVQSGVPSNGTVTSTAV